VTALHELSNNNIYSSTVFRENLELLVLLEEMGFRAPLAYLGQEETQDLVEKMVIR